MVIAAATADAAAGVSVTIVAVTVIPPPDTCSRRRLEEMEREMLSTVMPLPAVAARLTL